MRSYRTCVQNISVSTQMSVIVYVATLSSSKKTHGVYVLAPSSSIEVVFTT